MLDRMIRVIFTSFRDSNSVTRSSHTLRKLHKGDLPSYAEGQEEEWVSPSVSIPLVYFFRPLYYYHNSY